MKNRKFWLREAPLVVAIFLLGIVSLTLGPSLERLLVVISMILALIALVAFDGIIPGRNKGDTEAGN